MERVLQAAVYLRDRILTVNLPTGLTLIGLAYLLAHFFLGGLKMTHILFTGLIFTLYFLHSRTRSFVVLALPLLLQNMIYDGLRYVPFDWVAPIHVAEPYEWEQRLFGIAQQGAVILPNEYLLRFATHTLDLVLGTAYHLLDPMMVILLLLLWRLRPAGVAQRFAAAFLLMNLLAFVTYLLYPAAAPWYVSQYGFAQPPAPVGGNAAGLSNLDLIVGSDVSEKIYGLCPFVFGAIPSMHAGFTVLGGLFALRIGKTWGFVYGAFALLTWVGAVYLQHHYIIDLIIGAGYAVAALWIVERPLRRAVEGVTGRLSRRLVEEGPPPWFG